MSCANFTKPVRDPNTGDILKDKDGAHIKFVPQSLRATCPIKSSNKFKDDTKMQNLFLEGQRNHDEWKQKLGATTKKIAKLEVSLRKRELKE